MGPSLWSLCEWGGDCTEIGHGSPSPTGPLGADGPLYSVTCASEVTAVHWDLLPAPTSRHILPPPHPPLAQMCARNLQDQFLSRLMSDFFFFSFVSWMSLRWSRFTRCGDFSESPLQSALHTEPPACRAAHWPSWTRQHTVIGGKRRQVCTRTTYRLTWNEEEEIFGLF